MKYLLTLTFILALAPFAHAQSGGQLGAYCNATLTCDSADGYTCDIGTSQCQYQYTGINVNNTLNTQTCTPNSIHTNSGCLLCPSSCISGDSCTNGTCQQGNPTANLPGGTQTSQNLPGGINTGTQVNTNTNVQTGLFNPLSAGTNLSTFLNDILGFVVKIGTVAVVLMMVYVGFLFTTARGDTAQLSKAREALLWTVIGALIVLGAQAIASGIAATAQALSSGS